jgi:peptide/nickel transport system ATP-binding protein
MDIQRESKTTMLFISHDLSVVRYIADRVVVMYLGYIVEQGTTEQIFAPPYHPYTEALLSAIPIADTSVVKKRVVLEGDVPSAMNPPPGCPFQTRCRWKKFVPDNKCETELPPFRDLGAGHRSLCWLNDEQLATQEAVIRFDKSKVEDPSTAEPMPGTRVTTAPVAKQGEAAEVASETADPASPAHEALAGSPPSGTKGRRRPASAVPGSSDPAVSEGEVGDGREGASARVRPGTIEHEAPAEPDSGTAATGPAKANKGGSRAEGRPGKKQ